MQEHSEYSSLYKPTNVVLSVLLYKIVKAETKLHNFICIPINSFVHIFILFLYQTSLSTFLNVISRVFELNYKIQF